MLQIIARRERKSSVLIYRGNKKTLSGREDLNLRPLGPEPSALAPALLPVFENKESILALTQLVHTYTENMQWPPSCTVFSGIRKRMLYSVQQLVGITRAILDSNTLHCCIFFQRKENRGIVIDNYYMIEHSER